MATRYAWALNLDAEVELTRPLGYHPTARVRHSLGQVRSRIHGLVEAEDIVLGDDPLPKPQFRGYLGRAWCPTPRALHLLLKSGATVPPAPSLACLQQVCSRRFNAGLGQPLPGAVYVTSREELTDPIAQHATRGGSVLKRDYGFTGRGQRRISKQPLPDDEKWIQQALAQGGLQVEPWMPIEAEFAIHGWLTPQGAVTYGAICGQQTDAQGAWIASYQVAPATLPADFERALRASAEEVAAALTAAGYFGPFGIDSYVYRDLHGQVRFNPKSDLNARYTMGYAIGMGAQLAAQR